jgi:hypothetical protein
MLLVLTNSRDETADFLLQYLTTVGVEFIRLDTDALIDFTRISYLRKHFRLVIGKQEVSPDDISVVWYRRPEQLKMSSRVLAPEVKFSLEEWSEALEGFLARIPVERWMNHPAFNTMASHKLEQLVVAEAAGLHVPDSLITPKKNELVAFFRGHQQQIIAKPLAPGYIERPSGRDSLIYTNSVTLEHIDEFPDDMHCPTLFQELIRKKSDVRITIVDDVLHAVEMLAPDEEGVQQCDVRRNNMVGVEYRHVCLPDDIERKLRFLMRRYHLRFAAVDMAITPEEEWIFFEINPNGQWAWLDIEGETDIASLFLKPFSHSHAARV